VFTNSWTHSERRFHVVIDGIWDGRVLALSESYDYADGLREHKSWRLQQTAPGVFTGTYDDTIGPASIWLDGPVVRLHYKLKLAGIALDFDETMTLRDDGSVIDRARVTKWGVPVGRLEVVMRRAGSSPPHSNGEGRDDQNSTSSSSTSSGSAFAAAVHSTMGGQRIIRSR
jgi:hypothetical protein